MNSSNFVHFRVQSAYSMLESTITISKLIGLAQQNHMNAVCLSDKGNLFGSLEFAIAASKASLQPIHAAILNIQFTNQKSQDFAEILLIAKNKIGYSNLLKLVSITFTQNNRKLCNHINFCDLQQYNEGLLVLSAYTEGIIGKLLLQSSKIAAIEATNKFKYLFGDRFYFEIMRHGTENEKSIESEYLSISRECRIPLIATNQVLFDDPSMYEAHDILLCIADSTTYENDDRKRVSNQCYFKSSDEMINLFQDLPEAIKNSVFLAQRCSFMSETRPPSLPYFTDNKSPLEEETLIRSKAKEGLDTKLYQKFLHEKVTEYDQAHIIRMYTQRLEYELDIICKMGFAGYFLIVSDFVRWSKQNNIAVGPGRGSGAGSITAWAIQITELDPIKFGLLFERFLNPERISIPDFDIDFCQDRREEVISYVRSKYGEKRVGQIITFGKMQAKAVIKDVSRVLGLNYTAADYLTTLIPFNAINPVTLKQAIHDVKELQEAAKGHGLYNYDSDKTLISYVLSMALKLEGLPRHISIHAAGIVICNQNITNIVPVYTENTNKMLVVQYSMKYAEAAGLVKFDFLGLQTLTVITKAIELIKNHNSVTIDITSIPFDDKKTFDLLSKGLSSGVFQFESLGMKNALCKLKPDSLDDIIALGALYRPGPMNNIPTYIACKHGKQQVDYLHPLLEPILRTTYGVIIYQEQVMEIAQILSGYSLASADLLRRAMGKKIKSEMDAQKEQFINGAIKNKVSSHQAQSIFNTVAKFAGYGFNKSHASAYGIISYQTAYLKANFPEEFLVSCLNLEIHNSDKISIFLQEARIFGINVIPPDINRSCSIFSILIINGKKSIVFAIGAIKNVTMNCGEHITFERLKNGKFTSILDFVERIEPKILNKRILENIIKAGCFDQINSNRSSLIYSIPKILSYCTSYNKEKSSNQCPLIPIQSNNRNILIDTSEYSIKQLGYLEFESTGLFLNHHPLTEVYTSLQKYEVRTSAYLRYNINNGSYKLKLTGIIVKKDSRISAKGRFILLTLSDTEGLFEVTVFDEDILRKYSHLIILKNAVVIDCHVFKDTGGIRITAIKFISIKDILSAIGYHIKLYPQTQHQLTTIVNILLPKKHQSKSNSIIEIFLNVDGEFMAKILLPKQFVLNEGDITLLYKVNNDTNIVTTKV